MSSHVYGTTVYTHDEEQTVNTYKNILQEATEVLKLLVIPTPE